MEREGRILLATQAFKNQEISAIREAARRFEVPESTLRSVFVGLHFALKPAPIVTN
jgi:hypothetical protein